MKLLFLFWLLVLNFTVIFKAYAEYRVFELVIQNQKTKAERIVISSLDPLQYPGYYDLNQDEFVMYRDTWMCWGDTSQHKPYCPKPQERPQNQSPVQRELASP